MSESIRVGDLVYIAKPNPCGCDKGVGIVFHVQKIDRSNRWNRCQWCGHNCGTYDQAGGDGHGAALYRLRRIPPLTELDEAERKEELPV